MIISSARPSSRCKDNFREELAAGNGDINYVRYGYRWDEKRKHEPGSAPNVRLPEPRLDVELEIKGSIGRQTESRVLEAIWTWVARYIPSPLRSACARRRGTRQGSSASA